MLQHCKALPSKGCIAVAVAASNGSQIGVHETALQRKERGTTPKEKWKTKEIVHHCIQSVMGEGEIKVKERNSTNSIWQTGNCSKLTENCGCQQTNTGQCEHLTIQLHFNSNTDTSQTQLWFVFFPFFRLYFMCLHFFSYCFFPTIKLQAVIDCKSIKKEYEKALSLSVQFYDSSTTTAVSVTIIIIA